MERPIERSGFHRRLALPTLALSALTACVLQGPGAADGAGEAGVPMEACAGTPGQGVVDLVNGIRDQHDLAPLKVHDDLIEAALRHSMDQVAAAGAMAHIGSDGSAPGDRVRAAGYSWSLVSENVAAGYASAHWVVRAWMDSPAHRATILSVDAIHIGVGYVHDPTAPMRHFWTLNVAAPRASGASAGLACHP